MRDADIRAFLIELYEMGQQHDAREQVHPDVSRVTPLTTGIACSRR